MILLISQCDICIVLHFCIEFNEEGNIRNLANDVACDIARKVKHCHSMFPMLMVSMVYLEVKFKM